MLKIRIRPHHILCMRFFEGKGYSPAFVENMTRLKQQLEQSDAVVELTGDCDMVCAACPNRRQTWCVAEHQVRTYDDAMLLYCGLSRDTPYRWAQLQALASEKILQAGRLPAICADCQWYEICGGKVQ